MVEANDYTTLVSQIENASPGTTINLTADINPTAPLLINKNITINLNGYNLDFDNEQGIVADGENAIVTLTDSSYERPEFKADSENKTSQNYPKWKFDNSKGGLISSSNNAAIAQNGGTFILDKVNIQSTGNVAVWAGTRTSNGTVQVIDAFIVGQEFAIGVENQGSTLNVDYAMCEAKDNAVISGNGSPGLGGTNITINDGIFLGSIETEGYSACGIYHPQDGVLTVNGGSFYAFDGGCGILVRSGQVTLNGGRIRTYTALSNGKIGDSKVLPSPSVICVDTRSKYPGYENTQVVVNGGQFDAVFDENEPSTVLVLVGDDDTPTGKLLLRGGYYGPAIDDTYVDEGYVLNATGTKVTKA